MDKLSTEITMKMLLIFFSIDPVDESERKKYLLKPLFDPVIKTVGRGKSHTLS